MEEEVLICKIHQLYTLRREILESGEIAPEGCWIHTYEVTRQWSKTFSATYIYAKWQSASPMFKRSPKKRGKPPKPEKNPEYSTHQHIGRVSSSTGLGAVPEVEEAYAAVARRDRIHAIDEALKEIEAILNRVLPGASADGVGWESARDGKQALG